jgi:hypothetical protein
MYIRWIDVNSWRLQTPSEHDLRSYQHSIHRRVGETILVHMEREYTSLYHATKKAMDTVKNARIYVARILTTLNVLPNVLHPLIVDYSI